MMACHGADNQIKGLMQRRDKNILTRASTLSLSSALAIKRANMAGEVVHSHDSCHLRGHMSCHQTCAGPKIEGAQGGVQLNLLA
jgi:hypothetical protein